ncbi:MAG: DUF4339 domain-containing protein [Planctomycetes bacterium]|nr:DUF4339 domain-containing protein [Planctomycetota bacterium]
MAQWYYAIEGRRHGPVSSGELKRLADAGELSPADLVHKQGQAGWAKALKVKGLFAEQAAAAKPAPVEQPEPQAGAPESAAVAEVVQDEQPIVVEEQPIAADKQPAVEEQPIIEEQADASGPADELAALAQADSAEPAGEKQEQSPEDIFAGLPAETAESAGKKETEPRAEKTEEEQFEPLPVELVEAESPGEAPASAAERRPADQGDQTDTPADLAAISEAMGTEAAPEESEGQPAAEKESELFPVPDESESGEAEKPAQPDEVASFVQLESEASADAQADQPIEGLAEAPAEQPVDLFAEEPKDNPIDALTEASAGQPSDGSPAGAPAEGEAENTDQLTEEQLFEQEPSSAGDGGAEDQSAMAGFEDDLADSKSKTVSSRQLTASFDSAKTIKLEGLRAANRRARLPALVDLLLALVALAPAGLAGYFIFFPAGRPAYSAAVLMDPTFLSGSIVAAIGLLLAVIGLITGLPSKLSLAVSLAACAIQAVIFLPPFLPGDQEGKQAYVTSSLIRFGQALSAYRSANSEMPLNLAAVTPTDRMLPGDLKSILLSAGPADEFYYIPPGSNADELTIVAFDKAGLTQAKHVVLYFSGAVAVRPDKQFRDELDQPRNSPMKVLVDDEYRRIAEEMETKKTKPKPAPPGQTRPAVQPAGSQPDQEDPFPKDGKKSFFES